MNYKFLTITAFSLLMFALALSPAMAASGNVLVMNGNMADVHNGVMTNANTGGNYADGSYGGDGGRGGDISNGRSHDHDGPIILSSDKDEHGDKDKGGEIDDVRTGDGGDGGAASLGGTIRTGAATARTNLTNDVNKNLTEIDSCGCELDGEPTGETQFEHPDVDESPEQDGRLLFWLHVNDNTVVMNGNKARLGNRVGTNANTGDNNVDGSYGGEGGNGGDVRNSDGGEVEDSRTGSGGMGAASGEGGLVETGASNSRADVVNILNRNITRINR